MNLTWVEWLKIIKFIIDIIISGGSKEEAVKKAAGKFNVSEQEIWRHGGF